MNASGRRLARASLPALFLLGALLCCVAVAAEDAQPSYKIGPEDQFNVTVARHPEFSGTFYVPADGTVNLPVVGQVNVSGKTLSELSEAITAGLSQRLRDPEVTVSLQSPRMQRVYVLGVVEKPGLYDMKPNWRITEAIAAAGGLATGNEEADCKATILRARDGQRQTIPLVEVFKGAPESNARVESGDVITIEAAETIPVYVTGKVKSQGLYRLRKDTPGVIQAIALAGGALEEAALDRVSITRLDGSVKKIDLIPAVSSGSQEANVALQPGDLVVVPEETGRIAILGYVREPGFYPLKNGQKVMLSDAIGMAKGVEGKRSEIGSVVMIRFNNGKQDKTVYDMHKFFASGDASQNPEVKSGDVIYVPQTKRPDWDFLIRSLTAVGILINPFVP